MSYPNQLYHMEYSYFNWLPHEICEYMFNTFINCDDEEDKCEVLPIDDNSLNEVNGELYQKYFVYKQKYNKAKKKLKNIKNGNYSELSFIKKILKCIEQCKDKYIYIVLEEDKYIRGKQAEKDDLHNKNLLYFNEIVKKYPIVYIEKITLHQDSDYIHHPQIYHDKYNYTIVFIGDNDLSNYYLHEYKRGGFNEGSYYYADVSALKVKLKMINITIDYNVIYSISKPVVSYEI